MGETLLISEPGDGIVQCALSRPHKRNALNNELVNELLDLVVLVQRREDLVCVILTGGDSPDFCAGGDLGYLGGLSKSDAAEFSDRVYALCKGIETSPALWCVMLCGRTLGGGAELALACDRRFVHEGASLAFSQLKMGLPSGWGGFARLSKELGRDRALDMVLKAEVLDAESQVRLGLSHAIKTDGLSAVKQWMNDWCTQDAAVLRSAMTTFKSNGDRAVERAMFEERWGRSAHREALSVFETRQRS